MVFDQSLAAELSANERSVLPTFFACNVGSPTVQDLVSTSPEAASRHDADLATPLHLHLANARTPDGVCVP